MMGLGHQQSVNSNPLTDNTKIVRIGYKGTFDKSSPSLIILLEGGVGEARKVLTDNTKIVNSEYKRKKNLR